jgi:hypothetical protein
VKYGYQFAVAPDADDEQVAATGRAGMTQHAERAGYRLTSRPLVVHDETAWIDPEPPHEQVPMKWAPKGATPNIRLIRLEAECEIAHDFITEDAESDECVICGAVGSHG